MNNWKAIGYIFLGFGTVFLTFALCVFFGLMSTFLGTFLTQAAIPTSLAASAQWFVLAALMYVVGIVGYYAGKENDFKKKEESDFKKKEKPARLPISIRITPFWSFPIGVIAFAAAYLLMATSYLDNPQIPLDNLASPIIYSIVIGLVAGLISTVLIYRISDR